MEIQSNLDQELRKLGAGLRQYKELSGKTGAAVLEKKGRDLGIRLYQGYKRRQWGGKNRQTNQHGQAGIAWREMRARAREGRGTKVRPGILARERGRENAPATQGRKLTFWQRAVEREVATRQRGIGVLAVGFLWYRRRTSRNGGTTYVRNKTGRALGWVAKLKAALRIVNVTPGIGEVGARYGIPAAAIAEINADMAPYLRRKLEEAAREGLRSGGLRAA